MYNKLDNPTAVVLTTTCLYATGHWIAASVLVGLLVASAIINA